MKRFFYILFITVTALFSFGFRGCDQYFCLIIEILTVSAYGPPNTNFKPIVFATSEESEAYTAHCDSTDWCTCDEFSILSPYAVNDAKYYGNSSFMLTKSGIYSLVAVGDTGSVFYSQDGGATWEDRSIPGVDINLSSFDFLPIGLINVIVCGESGTIYKSTTSGSGWAWQQINTITTGISHQLLQ